MDERDVLNVWFEAKLVGQLRRDEIGKIGFQYNNNWLQDGFAISQQLPLSKAEYPPSTSKAHQFFVNLLPEGGARLHIVKDLKITDSDFELLKAIGGECAGALSILPTDYSPNTTVDYKKLTDEELIKIVMRRAHIASFFTEHNRPRLSLAGAQDKCPVIYDENNYFLPLDAAPSTHIIKFEMSDYRNIPAYEYFLTQLANAIDLPTIKCQLKKIKNHYFLLAERYDRVVITNNNIRRLHQEDFCQALGRGYDRKYQQDGGPSFYDCYKLIQNVSTNPIIDAENLLKWQIFNCLAGNSDGHSKNLALLYIDPQNVRLAPFYDLVCTRAMPRIERKLAMSVGNEFDPDILTMNINHWIKFCTECGIRPNYLFGLLYEISETLLNNVDLIREQFEEEHGSYPALDRIKKVVTKQCKKVLTLKNVILKV